MTFSGTKGSWNVQLVRLAELDFAEILRWTASNFGERQAVIYEATLLQAIDALRSGPNIIGTRPRDDLGSGIRTLHVARQRRNGRHFIVFHVVGIRAIEVLRLLHDSMDLTSHLPS
ncbi:MULTISPECIES: type II toxin-antitoxin system RelE/ParE family toxin [Methylomicrobium]|uniref:Plasmid stabilization system protein n=1 Tax=Methylomicrobium album BG8 TaxID=686340 RepID=H8GHW5_METAL|nr:MULTISPECIES: type II toxin-antitoxin system RelE/ParE family toxin [Methylomicrobium]EIC28949.1 plasmid stabilization system protein [Methylomicrobium album BG8]